jgi:hypothetical protein
MSSILAACTSFPATFGLRAFPGKVFRINKGNSYVSEVYGVMLYTDIRNDDGSWSCFAKGSPDELRREVMPIRG